MSTTQVELRIDPEFRELIPRLSLEEWNGLQENIRTNGCHTPIFVWDDIIIDGHNRYEICTRNDINFEVERLDFKSRADARIWIIRNQFDRRNLSSAQRMDLALLLKTEIKAKAQDRKRQAGKETGRGNKKVSPKSDEPFRTDTELAKTAGVGKTKLRDYEKVKENAVPALKKLVESGEVSVSLAAEAIEVLDQKQQRACAKAENPAKAFRELVKQQEEKALKTSRRELIRTKQQEVRADFEVRGWQWDGDGFYKKFEGMEPAARVDFDPVTGQWVCLLPGDDTNTAHFEDSHTAAIALIHSHGEQPEMEPEPEPKKETKAHVANNSGEYEWYTPAKFIEAARTAMGSIDCDPASCAFANETIKAGTFYDMESDGLAQTWHGNVWLNPPYSQPLISKFTKVVVEKFESSEIEQAIVLVNNATETEWFQHLSSVATAICLPKGRIRYINKEGRAALSPLQGQAILYLGESPTNFASGFSFFGVTRIFLSALHDD